MDLGSGATVLDRKVMDSVEERSTSIEERSSSIAERSTSIQVERSTLQDERSAFQDERSAIAERSTPMGERQSCNLLKLHGFCHDARGILPCAPSCHSASSPSVEGRAAGGYYATPCKAGAECCSGICNGGTCS
jgi:hypothetical protein